jgi:hypothetical protein
MIRVIMASLILMNLSAAVFAQFNIRIISILAPTVTGMKVCDSVQPKIVLLNSGSASSPASSANMQIRDLTSGQIIYNQTASANAMLEGSTQQLISCSSGIRNFLENTKLLLSFLQVTQSLLTILFWGSSVSVSQ